MRGRRGSNLELPLPVLGRLLGPRLVELAQGEPWCLQGDFGNSKSTAGLVALVAAFPAEPAAMFLKVSLAPFLPVGSSSCRQ